MGETEEDSLTFDTVSPPRVCYDYQDAQKTPIKNARVSLTGDEIDPFYYGSPGRTRDQLAADTVCACVYAVIYLANRRQVDHGDRMVEDRGESQDPGNVRAVGFAHLESQVDCCSRSLSRGRLVMKGGQTNIYR